MKSYQPSFLTTICYEIRNQLQEKWKIHKYLEIKQQDTEYSIGHRNQREKSLETNKNGNTAYRNQLHYFT